MDNEVEETIPEWVRQTKIGWSALECTIEPNTDGGFTVINHALQCALAHSKSREALVDWLK